MVGRAGRYAFFSTLALLIFLLFFSVINIRVVRLPVERAIDGKRHQLSIGLSFNLLEEAKPGGDIQTPSVSSPKTAYRFRSRASFC